MPRFTVGRNQQIIREGDNSYTNGLRMVHNTGGSYFLQCCGLAGLEALNSVHEGYFKDWQDKAEFLALLYRQKYSQGTLVYAITNTQLNNPIHQLFLEIGAVQMGEPFPNLYHGPNMIHMFRVNIRHACGRFCNKYGEAYAEPPKDDSEVDPNEDARPTQYMYLPQRQV